MFSDHHGSTGEWMPCIATSLEPCLVCQKVGRAITAFSARHHTDAFRGFSTGTMIRRKLSFIYRTGVFANLEKGQRQSH
ncbi:hypothetical protein BZL30_0685 [Mycobacterium kansasii]|uniref:Uncharacterized protein n=1 Tax=Mycobacterium kansasii TaxID=1768 RepID=A0A1V3XTQ3_MYCKA|nr:hypothetical protein BZL30_0685 [Mycobacterium kansasii]